jgi:glycosyltransferase involved in cell wall biosynthesis
MTIKVHFDVTPLTGQKLTGIGVYSKYLIRGVCRLPGVECSASYRVSRFKKRALVRQHVQLPTQVYLPVIAGVLPAYQIFHGPDFRVPPTCFRKKVVTIHDMAIFEEGLTDAQFARQGRARFIHSLRSGRPDHVIVISEFTRQAFVARFPEWAFRTSVVHLGMDHIEISPVQPPAPYPFPYLLFVGTVERRKNVDGIIAAFGAIARTYPDLRLVIAGGKGYEADLILGGIAETPAPERIIYRGFVSDQERTALYRHARCLVYPSRYEGFGIPILEAMRLDCPVITSNCGAMQEVSGGAALHADPRRPDSIAEALVALLEDDALRQRLVAAGQERVRAFTWAQCALNTLNVYQKLL